MAKKIAIICLDAKGAVLRSWAILPGIQEKFPDAQVTWITNSGNKDLFKGNPYKINVLSPTEINLDQKFDIIYNFDTEKVATTLASNLEANTKYGFYEENEYPAAFNGGAEYYLNTLFDDELKKTNTKTYQQMMYDIAEIKYHKQRCPLVLDANALKYAEEFKHEHTLSGKIVGIHMGASSRWPSKVWSSQKVKEFIVKCSKNKYSVILFGGPNELESHALLSNELKKQGVSFAQNNPHNSDLEFASLVNICDVMVCSDSFSLHVSLALGKKTVCLFFCTSPNEIESYGLLTKIISPKLYEFFPERMNEYNEDLVNSISTEEVLTAL